MIDSLSGTLIVVPAVVGALWLMGRWVRRRGAQVLSRRAVAAELSILLSIVLLARVVPSLGLSDGSVLGVRLLAAALALLLTHHVVALVRGLAAALGPRLPMRPAWPFLVLPLVVYVATLPWSLQQRQPDGDEPYYLLVTHSIAFDLDRDLSNNYAAQDSLAFMDRALEPEWADPRSAGGASYSRHSSTLPLVLSPAYRVGGRAGALLVMAAIAALGSWMMLRLAARYFPRQVRGSLAAWALLSLTPPYLLYAHQVWTELPAALLLLVGLDAVYSLESGSKKGGRAWLRLLLALALLPLLKLRFALIAGSLATIVLLRLGWRRREARIALIALVTVVAAILLVNATLFEQALKDHSLDTLKQIQARPPAGYLKGAFGLFFDCAFGLFASNPLWLLAVPAALGLVASRPPLLRDGLICAVPYLLVVVPRLEWYGAWSPPFRFGMVLLPLLAASLIPLLAAPRRGLRRATLAALASVALALGVVWLMIPAWTYNLANGTSHLIDHLSRTIGADAGRFFPSYVRPRAASSVTPVALGAAMIALWGLGRSRDGVRSGWGQAAGLALVAVLPLAAHRLPTRVIELEDHQVAKSGGEVFPQPWVPGRPRFRGGWTLGLGDGLQAPVNAGGRSVEIALEVLVRDRPRAERTPAAGPDEERAPVGGPGLVAVAGDRVVPVVDLSSRSGWQSSMISFPDWPRGEDLELRLEAADEGTSEAELVVDRARFTWR